MFVDPSGCIPEWLGYLCWGLAAAAVVITAVGLVIASGGLMGAYFAAACACYGVASSSLAVTIWSFAFVGATLSFVGASMMASRSGNMLDAGPSVLFSTLIGGTYGIIGGKYSWSEQIKGLDHSWTTESRKFWKSEAQNPQSKFHDDERALKGLTPEGYVLHHPYGRYGSKIKIYVPIQISEHKLIHKQFGYGRGSGGFNQYYKFNNIWEWLRSVV